MDRIRVLIVEMPQLLTDIVVATVTRQPDLELAGLVATPDGLRRTLRHARTDVVVCRLQGGELPAVYRELFDVHPHLRLLAIDADDRSGSIYALRPDRVALDVRPQGLVAAIRSAGSARPFAWDAPPIPSDAQGATDATT